jgi:hypothetical protein
MNIWSAKRVNDFGERQPKSMPCHVVKVDKDFIYVQFETRNSIFTPPTVKIPQSWSQYSREPTQVGDKGYAVPGDYYLGGVTGDAGGNTDFYPRDNLTTLSFNGVSHKQNPDRDYDQLTHMGGPNGWIVGPYQKQQQDQGQQQQQSQPSVGMQIQAMKAGHVNRLKSLVRPWMQSKSIQLSSILDSGQQQPQQQQQDVTQFSFDKNGKALVQSKDANHNITVDQQNKTVSMKSSQTIYHDPGDGKVYLGGDGKNGNYAQVVTVKGPSTNTYARIS